MNGDVGRRVHFVGIGGIGMSALARLLLQRGHLVSGSDLSPGEQGRDLAGMGATVFTGHSAENVDHADLVVISAAVRDDNPEVVAARAAGLPLVKRSELLARVMNDARGLAVAGTHGKTTTSALLGWILVQAGFDPTVLIGGVSKNLGSNARVGRKDIVVAEADEYDGSFLRLRPAIAVITNAEPEHLDFYGTAECMYSAFRSFAQSATEAVIACADDPAVLEIVRDLSVPVITYGVQRGDMQAYNIAEESARLAFAVRLDGADHGFVTHLAGLHNVQNCLAAIACARQVGVEAAEIERGLESFDGVGRRFDVRGERAGVLVIDDYAHHPTEIRAVLAALKQRLRRPIRVIFQPHTYSRTAAFLGDFAQAFGDADTVYLLDVYAAREADTLGVSGATLAAALERHHADVRYVLTADAALSDAAVKTQPGDVLVTMGAGDVSALGPRLLEALAHQ